MKYTNPVISGFNPDPSICKVGGDYYLATSTFEYFPGLAIYHSTDLVNWEHISNAITRQSQLHYEKATASGGMWAPTIRHNNGRFYITATFMDYGNFIITTDDIYGEWSDPVQIEMDGIDPTILFDGDKMYYCTNDFGSRMKNYGTEGVSVAEMKPDTFEIIGDIKRVWEGAGGGWLEGPHIYHIGEWYYILAAEGGTGVRHMEVAARSSCKTKYSDRKGIQIHRRQMGAGVDVYKGQTGKVYHARRWQAGFASVGCKAYRQIRNTVICRCASE